MNLNKKKIGLLWKLECLYGQRPDKKKRKDLKMKFLINTTYRLVVFEYYKMQIVGLLLHERDCQLTRQLKYSGREGSGQEKWEWSVCRLQFIYELAVTISTLRRARALAVTRAGR